MYAKLLGPAALYIDTAGKEVPMAKSIQQLRIYQTARGAEDLVYDLVKLFPAEQYYSLGKDLYRTSAGVSHYIMEAHRLFSYPLKLDALASARREAEAAQKLLESARDLGVSDELLESYVTIIKQSFSLTNWFKAKLVKR